MYAIYCDASVQTKKASIALVILKDGIKILKVKKLLSN
jgi:hypothetical protein